MPGFFRSFDMLFTKHSQNAAQIEQTKGFDPIQRARHARAFCCQPFHLQSSPPPRMVYMKVKAELAFRGGSFAKVLQIADNKKGPTFR